MMLASADNDLQLLEAAKNGDFNEVRQLIEQGANVNVRGEHGMTPLLWASCNGHLDTTALISSQKGPTSTTPAWAKGAR